MPGKGLLPFCPPLQNLYYVEAQDFSNVAFMAKTAETLQLWHQHFAHLVYDNLATMATNSMVQGMSAKCMSAKAEDFKNA
eukprot:82242-Chlamydomonas_euryale.AAC.1